MRRKPRTSGFTMRARRLNIRTPFLTIGIYENEEEKLRMTPGKVITITSSGDMDRLTLFYAIVIVRSSLLVNENWSKARVTVVHPFNFTSIKLLKDAVTYYTPSRGDADNMILKFVETRRAEDHENAIKAGDFDVLVDLFADYYFSDPSHSNRGIDSFISAAKEEAMKGKLILLNRFSRKKRTFTRCDAEIFVHAEKRGNHDYEKLEIAPPSWHGAHTGLIRVTGDDIKIIYEINYPYTIK